MGISRMPIFCWPNGTFILKVFLFCCVSDNSVRFGNSHSQTVFSAQSS